MTGDRPDRPGSADREDWAERFEHQAASCDELGSPLYGRVMRLLAGEIRSGAGTWDVITESGSLRFGQAGPLRLLGAAHRLALAGSSAEWSAHLPSCGGEVPTSDDVLLVGWRALVDLHRDALVHGMGREVQTNEVGRSAGLALALAQTGMAECRLVEIGCSGALNLRLDHFDIDIGGVVLGDVASDVHLRPEIRGHLGGLRHDGLVLPRIVDRVGIDAHPIDVTAEEGQLTLLSFLWPDQAERIARVQAAIEVARHHPAELVATGGGAGPDTAAALSAIMADRVPTVVQQSIVWQYIATDVRWRITEVIEGAGSEATEGAPLAWVRYEPDEWDRRRAAVWLRRWPDGGDRLVAHVDYHGRWLAPA